MNKLLRSSLTMIALTAAEGASAADYLVPARVASFDWSGFYGGGHLGLADAAGSWSARQAAGGPTLAGTLDYFRGYDVFDGTGSFFGGLQAGYNFKLRPGVVFGIEADMTFPNTLNAGRNFSSPQTLDGKFEDTILMSGTVRGRVGFETGHWLTYVTGGLAWSADQFSRTQFDGPNAGTIETRFLDRIGWTAGAGIERPVAPGWTARFEYLYSGFGATAVDFPASGQRFQSDLSLQQVRFGLNYKLGDSTKPNALPWFLTAPPAPTIDDWIVRGQTTFLSQYAPPFRTPYRGQNSLDPNSGRETWDATLYIGRRLWEGAEFWIDPEIDQGFGLSGTLGVAGFPSGEAYKVGSSDPYLRLPRTFIRQTIDLGGASEKVQPDINQFGGSQSANRLVLTVGKFSVSDIFDTVKYAHDPRSDFMNWSLIDAGTFDYAADAWGFTYGAAAEWYQGNWTLRGGLFDLSNVPNSPDLDRRFEQFQFVYELEHRHELMGQPGKVAVVGFLSRGRMGRYDDAVALAAQTGTAADVADVRRYASRPGVNVNFEQQLQPNVGVFARAGYADGNVEAYEFTDIDRTASAGVSLAGKLWNRPDDSFGLAGVVNGISGAHVAYLNAGGLGILVGDGQLPHPGYEQILETYYSLPVGSWKVTADYQFIANPAFNRDRGPVSVISARLRTQF